VRFAGELEVDGDAGIVGLARVRVRQAVLPGWDVRRNDQMLGR
jgi:hypothetical protein